MRELLRGGIFIVIFSVNMPPPHFIVNMPQLKQLSTATGCPKKSNNKTVQNRPKVSKSVQSVKKCSKAFKVSKSVQKGPKCPKVSNMKKSVQKGLNCPKCPKGSKSVYGVQNC